MSNPRATRDNARPAESPAFDWDLAFLSRSAGPLMLLARAMLAYVFVVDGAGAIADYAGTMGYMRTNGVDPRLLPLVILTELGGGLLVLFGRAARWAALALCGFCLLTAFLIHWRANEMIEVQKNIAMAGGLLTLAVFGPGPWSLDGWRSRSTPQWSSMRNAPPNAKLYGNPLLAGVQATGDSTAMSAAWQPMREAGAIARTMLVSAAAKRWNVEPASCRAQSGEVLHPATGRSIKYGELAADAARMSVPESVVLKRPEDFKLIGTSAKRLDTPAKVNGSAVFGIDARPPGVKIATLAQSPVFGGRVKSLDDAAAKAVNGVRQIVRLDDAVAVVADHMGAAKKGLAALVIEWDDGPHAKLNTDEIVRELENATLNSGPVAQNIGDVDKAMASASAKVDATYQVPFLAHATMEPAPSARFGLAPKCSHEPRRRRRRLPVCRWKKSWSTITLSGADFGRRLEIDGVARAVEIAKRVDGPVKVVWTREEDIQHDMYRPYWFDRMSAGLDEKGMPVVWNHRFAGSSILARWLPPAFNNGLDPDSTDGAINLAYAIPNLRVEYLRVEPPGIPTAFWRSVGPSHNVFVIESFIDELAAAAKQDAVSYRRALLDKSPRAKAVLELAAEKAGWGQPLPDRVGRGVSVQNTFRTYMAQVAEACRDPQTIGTLRESG